MSEEEIEKIVKSMSDFVNSFGSNNEEFARLMGCEHCSRILLDCV